MRAQQFGAWGESVAAEHLHSKGLQILTRNWRCEEGEIDLIALDGDTIVIVEVRTRASDVFGTAEESVTPRKRSRLQRTALAYLDAEDRVDATWRIDVVAIDADRSGKVKSIEHYVNAIEGEY